MSRKVVAHGIMVGPFGDANPLSKGWARRSEPALSDVEGTNPDPLSA